MGFKVIDMLTRVRQPDQPWPQPLLVTMLVGESAVIETAAHTQSVAIAVKSHQWQQDQIQLAGKNQLARRHHRFRNAEAVNKKLAVVLHRCKPESVTSKI